MTATRTAVVAQALHALLPPGAAWPRDPGSTQARVVVGLAASVAELDDWITAAVHDWQPHTVGLRLGEWEYSAGLPDSCASAEQSVRERRQRLLARLRGPTLTYADSSPAALGALTLLCQELGLTVELRYNTPARVGRDRCGARLGQLDGRLHVLIESRSRPARVSRAVCGDRLMDRPPVVGELGCLLDRFIPARFSPVYTFYEV